MGVKPDKEEGTGELVFNSFEGVGNGGTGSLGVDGNDDQIRKRSRHLMILQQH
jgi:hypothetical protein